MAGVERFGRVGGPALAAWLLSGGLAVAAGSAEWLSVCNRCASPTVTASSGLGTARAVAEARMTRESAQESCSGATGAALDACLRTEMARVYRATADCPGGRITAIDGKTYTLAGQWTSDVGRGRSRWRDRSGAIVGQDNASNGLAISQQWEVLCPAGATGRPAMARPAPVVRRPEHRPVQQPGFAVGQFVQARYGAVWLRARITGVRLTQDGRGLAYDVALENGARGVVPPRMLRPLPEWRGR